jgi:glycosyltransferase involved in cell wall biosynthesis
MTVPTISATVITYNEERNIGDCLESIAWVDELIVVDSLSSDKTVDICAHYTRNIVQRPWPGHVLQKQFALEQATGDWILCLDADERLSPGAQEGIKAEIHSAAQDLDGFVFPRHSYYLGRGRGRWAGIDPHDKLIVAGKTKPLQSEILHYVYRNLSHQLTTVDSFSAITARQWQGQGKKFSLVPLLVKPPAKFFECYIWKKGFLDGLPGFIIAVASSFYVFLKYAKFWEEQQHKPAP